MEVRQAARLNLICRLKNDRPFDDIAQLAHVARPIVGHQPVLGLRRDFFYRFRHGQAENAQKMFGQHKNILSPLPQRRRAELDDIQTVK